MEEISMEKLDNGVFKEMFIRDVVDDKVFAEIGPR